MSDGSQWAAPPPEGDPTPERPGQNAPGSGQPASGGQPGSGGQPYYGPPGYPPPGPGQAYGQAPYGQAPYGQAPYGQAPYGQAPYGQAPYGQAPYGQAPYGQAPYGQAPYGQAPYGQAPYGQAPYGQAPYGHPGWQPGRPTLVTSAGVLGIVTGGLTAFGSLITLIAALSGEDDAVTVLLTLGLPCAVGLITGGVRLMQGHSARLLFVSALAALGVLLAALAAGLLTIDNEDDRIAVAAFVLFAAVLPIITAVFARLRPVTDWVASRPG
jgi:hypothetical protein